MEINHLMYERAKVKKQESDFERSSWIHAKAIQVIFNFQDVTPLLETHLQLKTLNGIL